jgi:autotransporter-associated beta strand protein
LASADGAPRTIANPVLLGANPAFGDVSGVFTGPVTYTGNIDFGAVTRYIRAYSDTVWATSSGNGGMTQKLGANNLILKGSHDWGAGAAVEVRQGGLVLDGATVANSDAVRVMATTPGASARLVLTNGASLTVNLNTANLRLGYTGGDPTATNVIDLGGTLTLPGSGTGGKVQLGQAAAASQLNLTTGGNLFTAAIQDVNLVSNDVVNCNGGKLTVIADSTNTAATAFLQGLDAVNLLDGGLTIDTNGNDTRINQAMAGGGGLVKQGAGTLTLGGTNSYGGATTVEAGTLAVVAPGTTGTAGATVQAGATLAGTGTVTGAAAVAGTVAPGTSAGALTVSGALTLQPDAAYRWEAASWSLLLPGLNYDTVVAGSLDITATAADPVTIVIAGTPGDFTETALSFPLIQTTGGITNFSAGKFVVDATGFSGTGTWSVSQSGNNLMLNYALGSSDPYAAWAGPAGFNLTGGKYDDDDGDGIANVLEFVLNGDPTKSGNRGLLRPLVQDASAPVGNQLTLVAAIRRGAVFAAGPGGSQTAQIGTTTCSVTGGPTPGDASGAVSHVGISDTAPAATGLPSLAGTDWEYHTFSLDASEGVPNRGFLRVRAAEAP